MKIALTGSTGFIGKELVTALGNKAQKIIQIGRNTSEVNSVDYIYVKGLNSTTQFNLSTHKCDVLVHCAARVHIMHDNSSAPLEDFREVNTYGTLNLAQQAADAGVKRFIFISSIKVNGESTELGLPFKSDDNFVPTDHYGLSKYEAEVGLREISAKTGMEVVIIRPPLVYGQGVKANFASIVKWVNKGIPLPLGSVNANKRSLVYLDNLVDLIVTCIDHPNAANQTFLVSDDHDVSTTELLREMARGGGRPSRLIPVPVGAMQFAANLVGKGAVAARLFGSLQVDIEYTKKVLNWTPPVSFSEGIRRCFYK
ncbi:SDR family oxidoreductase [Paraglaciecola sp. 20A4]|uniref:UDP-glucose 4-epimerase family protein n=1 Tax=Paraglaciecola sp. 20A4 TaxID=2687288 RepID=UPI00140AB8B3|nr:SDR family oxidoreductase [Paraglaciecola sp. 20A4]